MSAKPETDTIEGLAQFYHTGERNIVRYRSKHAPLDDPMKFKEWIGTQKSAPEGLMDRLDQLTDGQTAGDGDAMPANAGDWQEFEAGFKDTDPNEAMAKISKVRDWAFFQFERASKKKNKREEKFYSDLLAKMEGTLHDAQLRAKKLGIESGDLVSRKDLERPARFIGYHLLRCADEALGKLARAIGERDPTLPPMTAEEVRRLGEPLLLEAVVFAPMTRATEGDNAGAPPSWLVDAMRDGLAEVVE